MSQCYQLVGVSAWKFGKQSPEVPSKTNLDYVDHANLNAGTSHQRHRREAPQTPSVTILEETESRSQKSRQYLHSSRMLPGGLARAVSPRLSASALRIGRPILGGG